MTRRLASREGQRIVLRFRAPSDGAGRRKRRERRERGVERDSGAPASRGDDPKRALWEIERKTDRRARVCAFCDRCRLW